MCDEDHVDRRPDPFTPDQHLRLAALDQANRHYTGDSAMTVDTAKQFFAFLKGDA